MTTGFQCLLLSFCYKEFLSMKKYISIYFFLQISLPIIHLYFNFHTNSLIETNHFADCQHVSAFIFSFVRKTKGGINPSVQSVHLILDSVFLIQILLNSVYAVDSNLALQSQH